MANHHEHLGARGTGTSDANGARAPATADAAAFESTTDEEITRTVRRALEWDTIVPFERIGVSVVDGVVTLEGDVELWSQYDDAGATVGRLPGVRDVVNLMTVQASADYVASTLLTS